MDKCCEWNEAAQIAAYKSGFGKASISKKKMGDTFTLVEVPMAAEKVGASNIKAGTPTDPWGQRHRAAVK